MMAIIYPPENRRNQYHKRNTGASYSYIIIKTFTELFQVQYFYQHNL